MELCFNRHGKMIALQLTLTSLIISTNAISIGTVSEQNVTKREANVGDLFPDWVPFKNKHGEELGEFVQVTKKPKKRLAPPVNFILRAVAEPEGDDYFDKGQGESDSDDYYEKKEWSDTNRPSHASDSPKSDNHTEISEIDGVVNIITKTRPLNPVVEALRRAKNRQENDEIRENEAKKPPEDYKEDQKAASKKRHDLNHKYEDDIDYEESNSDKLKPEPIDEDQSENEARKAIILDGVDELKARHAKEQVLISEKAKEEEIYKEEREREKLQAQLSIDESDKYDDKPKTKKSFMDYEEYENKDGSLEEKYNINPERTTKAPLTTTRQPKRTSKRKGKKDKTVESGKLSVFKNPQLYIVYDEIDTTTIRPRVRPPVPGNVEKFSAKYTSTPSLIDDAERISLVPEEEGKEGEPTLFFPKKRKGSKRRKSQLTTASESEETSSQYIDRKPKLTSALPDTTGSDTIIIDTTAETGPAADVTTISDVVTDAVPASTDHKEDAKKEENYHKEKGGGKEYHSDHEESHSEEGKKAYEGIHKETKSAKGHHDKENHLGKYDDHGGIEKNHEEESGHYGAHHHEEHGKKHAKYEESGKHSKGHSTKGSHDIHKKEEYEKNVEFFEEEGDSGEEEKHGGFNEEHGHSKGGHFKNGDYKAGHEEHAKGESGHFEKGGHLRLSKGHKSAAGHDQHGKKGTNHQQKESKDSGRKWIYHHGYPPKTANLVLIDRRADQLYHGPQYYG